MVSENSSKTSDETESSRFPSTLQLLSGQLFERLAFYGLQTVLLLYFLDFLLLDKIKATVSFHLFSFGYYFTGTFASLLSDLSIGFYPTVLLFFAFYFLGLILFGVASVATLDYRNLGINVIGLIIISIGVGGVNPRLVLFGAHQSDPTHRYYSWFFLVTSISMFASGIVAPIIQSESQCFGYNCFALVYLIAIFLVLIAGVIFTVGRSSYQCGVQTDSMSLRFFGIIFRAIFRRFKENTLGQIHWLHHANDRYHIDDVEDTRHTLRILVLIVPMIIYHSLANQVGSLWTYQATQMNGRLGPGAYIQPDQMQAFRGFFLAILFPIFDRFIFPQADRFPRLLKPLQRIFFGMIFLVSAFIAAAIVQSCIDRDIAQVPVRLGTQVYNGFSCPVTIDDHQTLESNQIIPWSCENLFFTSLNITSNCDGQTASFTYPVGSPCPSAVIIHSGNFSQAPVDLTIQTIPFNYPESQPNLTNNFAIVRLVGINVANTTLELLPNRYTFDVGEPLVPTSFQYVVQAQYHLYDPYLKETTKSSFYVLPNSVYTVLVMRKIESELTMIPTRDLPPMTIHVLWQTFQYFLLAISDVIVILTMLPYLFEQAPNGYSGVVQSAYYLAFALGDLFVILVVGTNVISNQRWQFAFFSILMIVDILLFGAVLMNFRERKVQDDSNELQPLLTNPTVANRSIY